MLKVLKWMGLLFVGGCVLIVVLAIVFGISETKSRSQTAAAPSQSDAGQTTAATTAPQREVQVFSAGDLARAYEENTVSADQQFKGYRYRVAGMVKEISTDFTGAPYISMTGGSNPFMAPQFKFAQSQMEALGRLKRGQKVMVECTGGGDVVKTPMSVDCELL